MRSTLLVLAGAVLALAGVAALRSFAPPSTSGAPCPVRPEDFRP
ncbi:hypothetical protein [Myxococcus sp. CA040A]|nr:hypothetical protein [Myxococcus sp. CA040A]